MFVPSLKKCSLKKVTCSVGEETIKELEEVPRDGIGGSIVEDIREVC